MIFEEKRNPLLTATRQQFIKRNPILIEGEVALEKRKDGAYLLKIGDGVHRWIDLPYANLTVKSAIVNSDGHLLLKMCDGSSVDCGCITSGGTGVIPDASKISYDNKSSGLESVTVQTAIDEVAKKLDDKLDKNADSATSSSAGLVKPDGTTTTTSDDGTISIVVGTTDDIDNLFN